MGPLSSSGSVYRTREFIAPIAVQRHWLLYNRRERRHPSLLESRLLQTWDRDLARSALDSFALSAANREIADYWLSLWTQSPPTRSQFEPRHLKAHIPALGIFEVMPDDRVICRLAGSYLESALGYNLTGRDLLEVTPKEEREDRIRFTHAIVEGAISFALRRFLKPNGSQTVADEIALPFADITGQGGRRYLFHSAWRPEAFGQLGLARRPATAGLGFDQRIVSICVR